MHVVHVVQWNETIEERLPGGLGTGYKKAVHAHDCINYLKE